MWVRSNVVSAVISSNREGNIVIIIRCPAIDFLRPTRSSSIFSRTAGGRRPICVGDPLSLSPLCGSVSVSLFRHPIFEQPVLCDIHCQINEFLSGVSICLRLLRIGGGWQTSCLNVFGRSNENCFIFCEASTLPQEGALGGLNKQRSS